MDTRQLFLDESNGIDRLFPRFSEFFISRPKREGESVENQVGWLETVFPHSQIVNSFCNLELPLGRLCHPAFVNGKGDNSRSKSLAQWNNPIDSFLPVFKIDRVDNCLPANPLERFFDHGSLGRVDD